RIARIAVEELARIGAERRERGEMRPRRGAEQRETLGIDPMVRGVGAQELHGRHDVVHGVRKRLGALLRQAIADREQRIAVRRKIRSPKLKLSAHALLPAAAMHSNQRRERPSAFRQVEIALQRNAVMGGVGQGGTKFMLGRAGHWSSSPRFGKFVFVWWD